VELSERIGRLPALGICAALLSIRLLCAATAQAQEPSDSASTPSDQSSTTGKTSTDHATVRLKIEVTGNNDKPVSNASVYVRYDVPAGLIHKDRLVELDLKTNGDGSARSPAVPQGKILIQVIAPGWHTYGKWYDVEGKEEDSIEIKLEPPHRWY
jgi:hypothetical protein